MQTKAKKQLFVRKEGQRPLALRGLERTSGAFKEPGGPFLSGAFEAAWGRYKKSGGNGGQGKLVAKVFGWETFFLAGKDSFGSLGGPLGPGKSSEAILEHKTMQFWNTFDP